MKICVFGWISPEFFARFCNLPSTYIFSYVCFSNGHFGLCVPFLCQNGWWALEIYWFCWVQIHSGRLWVIMLYPAFKAAGFEGPWGPHLESSIPSSNLMYHIVPTMDVHGPPDSALYPLIKSQELWRILVGVLFLIKGGLAWQDEIAPDAIFMPCENFGIRPERGRQTLFLLTVLWNGHGIFFPFVKLRTPGKQAHKGRLITHKVTR